MRDRIWKHSTVSAAPIDATVLPSHHRANDFSSLRCSALDAPSLMLPAINRLRSLIDRRTPHCCQLASRTRLVIVFELYNGINLDEQEHIITPATRGELTIFAANAIAVFFRVSQIQRVAWC
jgi:hypothetical protein